MSKSQAARQRKKMARQGMSDLELTTAMATAGRAIWAKELRF